MTRPRFPSRPDAPPFVPSTSTSTFGAVRAPTPPELAGATVEPDDEAITRLYRADRANPIVQAEKIRVLTERLNDLENRHRVLDNNLEERVDAVIVIREGAKASTLLGAVKATAKVLLIGVLSIALAEGVKWGMSQKSAPALRYDKDGIPLPR